MTFLQAIISGTVQGLTEFLPVSSSGHLVILHALFGLEEPQQIFDIYLHLSTLGAVFCVFRKDILAALRNTDNFGLWIIVASIPTALIGIAGDNIFEGAFGNVSLVGIFLIITGVVLIIGEACGRYYEHRGEKKLSARGALIIGSLQGLALFPGISRSGITVTSSLLCGLTREKALAFSFCLAIPAILGAAALKIASAPSVTGGMAIAPLLGGMAASFLVGYAALRLVIKLLIARRFHFFAFYCIPVGVLVLFIA